MFFFMPLFFAFFEKHKNTKKQKNELRKTKHFFQKKKKKNIFSSHSQSRKSGLKNLRERIVEITESIL